ncbi:MAG: carotenoid biosynthesis protein [Bacteroidetes bacterium]|nr:carotenoid biosynthesis protein [Bacteroidota bacterium]
MKDRLVTYFPIVLLVFHVVGIVLFSQIANASKLTWLNILLCGFLVFLSESNLKKAGVLLVVIFVLGFVIELIGVKTGFLFGNYFYGKALGANILQVPIIIGLNWFIIVVTSSNVFRSLKLPIILLVLLSGLLATLMDALIEPVAIKFDFWHWKTDQIPFFNYVCWFLFSSLFSYLYLSLTNVQNKTAFYLFFIWLVFFIMLNFI